jgi:RNA recognition motif-containing protein
VRIILDRGRPNGMALVRFATPQDAQEAAAAKHMQHLGGRYIEVFPCSRDDVQRYMARSY